MKKIIICSIILFSNQYGLNASIKATFDDFLYETKIRANYYKPYAIVGSFVGAAALTTSKISSLFIACAGIYSSYAWYKGFFEIQKIRHKYRRKMVTHDHWSDKPENEQPFLFCRWRQQDNQFGDGLYWPTAWWMQEHHQEVTKQLIADIYSNRIVLTEKGKKIEFPRPEDVLRSINRELNELETDKEMLKQYTNIYRTCESAEEFYPDTSYWRLFWPNYNQASRLYVDIVTMMKRLEVLREIISNMKLFSGGHGWPAVH